MWCGEIKEDKRVFVDWRVFVLLGPNDTRTATHLLYGGTAIPLSPQSSQGASK